MRYVFTRAVSAEARRIPWQQMEAEDMTRVILWNCAEPTLVDWLGTVDPAHALLWLAHDTEGRLCGSFWVNPVLGLCGYIHFAIFRAGRQDWENLGRASIKCIFAELPLASLLAFWPAPFQHVGRAVKRWGFGKPLLLPKACHIPTKSNPNRCRNGLMAVLSREKAERFL